MLSLITKVPIHSLCVLERIPPSVPATVNPDKHQTWLRQLIWRESLTLTSLFIKCLSIYIFKPDRWWNNDILTSISQIFLRIFLRISDTQLTIQSPWYTSLSVYLGSSVTKDNDEDGLSFVTNICIDSC